MKIAYYQLKVDRWMQECFGADVASDVAERSHRFLEEALELVQSVGCTADEARQLVDYVFGRPAGEPRQEVGGVMVTLSALANAGCMDIRECAVDELAGCWNKIEKIRAKQASKPHRSPLPGATTCR